MLSRWDRCRCDPLAAGLRAGIFRLFYGSFRSVGGVLLIFIGSCRLVRSMVSAPTRCASGVNAGGSKVEVEPSATLIGSKRLVAGSGCPSWQLAGHASEVLSVRTLKESGARRQRSDPRRSAPPQQTYPAETLAGPSSGDCEDEGHLMHGLLTADAESGGASASSSCRKGGEFVDGALEGSEADGQQDPLKWVLRVLRVAFVVLFLVLVPVLLFERQLLDWCRHLLRWGHDAAGKGNGQAFGIVRMFLGSQMSDGGRSEDREIFGPLTPPLTGDS
eukprot:TRINITY_DN32718_c0_g1_i1.p2 TRINITY_DN32718_c0_g1~~TRINITY_DN32718_c0_g1_i1.p2  ORF type:complete len:288 (-),score=23.95 TRINITY_DN32718_c0_g1_i1:123-947(-)